MTTPVFIKKQDIDNSPLIEDSHTFTTDLDPIEDHKIPSTDVGSLGIETIKIEEDQYSPLTCSPTSHYHRHHSSSDDMMDVVKILEDQYKQKFDLYEKLGKSCPSFASFEIAVNECKGAQLLPSSNTYRVFNVNDLFLAWSENMNYLTKRKKSEKHWQAGLKKWLDGQWRKDKKSFDLVLKEQKVPEANQIRTLVSQLCHVKEDIIKVIKAPAILRHHHHYYCKCGSPSVSKIDNLQILSQKGDVELHHHHKHYVEEQSTVPLESPQPQTLMEEKVKCEEPSSISPSEDEQMDYEVSLNETSTDQSSVDPEELKSIKKRNHSKKRRYTRGGSSPLSRKKKQSSLQQKENHTQLQNQLQDVTPHFEQTTQPPSKEFNFEWPPQIHLPEVELPQWHFPEVQLPQVQWPQMPEVQWPHLQWNLPQVQLPQIPEVQWPHLQWNLPQVQPPQIPEVQWPQLNLSEVQWPHLQWQLPEVQWPQNFSESFVNLFKRDNK